MKRTYKRILSFVLALCMILTGTLSGVTPRESAYAADSPEELTFEFRYGKSTALQLNTNLPSDKILVSDFTDTDNSSNINREGSSQDIWYSSMLIPQNEDVVIITFNYQNDMNIGDKVVINKGSEFGFKDKNDESKTIKYVIGKTYTFVYKGGEKWELEIPEPKELVLTYVDGSDNQIIFNTNLPSDTECADFLKDYNGCDIKQGEHTFGWIHMKKDGEVVQFILNFTTAFKSGESYSLKNGSSFGFKGTFQKYNLNADVTLYFNGSKWQSSQVTDLSLTCLGGDCRRIRLSTNLPKDTPREDFEPGNNKYGTSIEQSINSYRWVGYVAMPNDTDDIILDFIFNEDFLPGQTYILPKGAVFGFADEKKYTLDKTYTFWFDGKQWTTSTNDGEVGKMVIAGEEKTVVKETTLSAAHTGTNLVQFANFYDFGLSEEARINFVGTVYINGVKIENPSVWGYKTNETICFKSLELPNNTLTIMAGSVIYYEDKAVIIKETFHKKATPKTENQTLCDWSDGKTAKVADRNLPVILGDANKNLQVDILDLVDLKKAEATNDVSEFNDLVTDDTIDEWDTNCMRKILSGQIVDMTKESPNSVNYLLAESRFNGGEDFITFADRPADPTDINDIKRYKQLGFNTSLMTGEYGNFLNMYIDIQKSEPSYELKSDENELILEKVNSYANAESGGNIQIRTNMPLDGTYADFTLSDPKGHTIKFEKSNDAVGIWYFGLAAETGAVNEADRAVYLTPVFQGAKNQRSASYTFKAGTKFKVNDTTTYALTRDYTFIYEIDYLKGIENLDNEGLNVWLRTTSNKKEYLTNEFANLIAPYKDIIDGMYMNDEPFETEELYTYSKEKYNADEATESFENLSGDMATWFNNNLSNKYFHVNHVPVTSYNHYGKKASKAIDYTSYSNMFSNYKETVLNKVTATDKQKTIGFDNYPFGYSTTEKLYWWKPAETSFKETGIEPTYLVNLLIPAQTAKANNNTYSVCIQTYDKVAGSKKRVVDTKQEVTMQLYSSMACGASMFEYFLYHAQPSTATVTGFDGIIGLDGNKKTLYDATKQANSEAFPFANIINTFDWQGAEVIQGSDSKNSEAIKNVNESGLKLVLNNDNDGVLSASSATNDALVGYYKKGNYDGYMVANFNDPKVVSTKNSVKLTFAGCNTARVYTSESGKFSTKVVELAADGSYTFDLQPGGGCFVIPVNATK